MIEFRFEFEGILIGAFFAKNSAKNVIFAAGLPQYVSNYHPFLKNLTDLGFNVFVPRYYGSFESAKKFSVENSRKTIAKTVDFVNSCRGKSLFDGAKISWENSETSMLGFSFGANFAIENSEKISRAVMISPFLPSLPNFEKSAERELNFISRAYKNVYRFENFDNFLREFEISEIEFAAKDFAREIKIFCGEKDEIMTPEYLAKLRKISPNLCKFNGAHTVNLGLYNFEKIFSK